MRLYRPLPSHPPQAIAARLPATRWRWQSSTTIRLDDKLERELNRLAKAQHRTKSELARDRLRRHILVRELAAMRNKLRPYAEAAGHLTGEDFLRNIYRNHRDA
ncbi:MAG: ribbon-helix-helix protein, CopG family [Gammaproteobacteria bacterium]|nr:ribbon-helix-helix protein, CopG family [Gammaproteobacteria bacterium]